MFVLLAKETRHYTTIGTFILITWRSTLLIIYVLLLFFLLSGETPITRDSNITTEIEQKRKFGQVFKNNIDCTKKVHLSTVRYVLKAQCFSSETNYCRISPVSEYHHNIMYYVGKGLSYLCQVTKNSCILYLLIQIHFILQTTSLG